MSEAATRSIGKVKVNGASIGEQLSEQTAALKDDLVGLGNIAKKATSDEIHKLSEKGLEKAEKIADEIRGHPYYSLLIAAGLGAGLAFLLRGK